MTIEYPVIEFQGIKVATVNTGETTWYHAAPVGKALHLKNVTRSVAALADYEKQMWPMPTAKGPQVSWTVNEQGLYSLALASSAPEALEFREWLVSELLPAVRGLGQNSPLALIADPSTGTESLEALLAKIEGLKPALNRKERIDEIEERAERVARSFWEPKVDDLIARYNRVVSMVHAKDPALAGLQPLGPWPFPVK